jgi:predicted DNA binding protein
MKRIRATVTVGAGATPPEFFDLLANTPEITVARVLDVNTTLSGVDNYLFALEGDAAGRVFAERAPAVDGVESVHVSDTDRGRAYALVAVRSLEVEMYDSILRASSRLDLIVRTPIVYRDGKVHGTGVGDPERIQRAIDEIRGEMDVRIDEISEFRGDDPTRRLSDRQYEALSVALSMGYYERPREATHADVAAELGCAPSTASGHLQKAEAELVRAAMDGSGR